MIDQKTKFTQKLTNQERILIQSLDSPYKIQQFLDTVTYPSGPRNRSVLSVLQDRKAHCLDGGLFAAAMLSFIGHPAVIVDLLPDPGTDDDHVLAIYRVEGYWGAVAKSNFLGLRFREPVYKSLRELVMSYFEQYFNIDGKKTLRGYTRPIALSAYDRYLWMVNDEGVDIIEKKLYKLSSTPILPESIIQNLNPADKATYDSGLSISNPDGLYKPKTNK